jgi:hypothetical protein
MPYRRFEHYEAVDEEGYDLDRDYVESRWGTRELAPPRGYGSMERSSRDRPLGPPYPHHDPGSYLGRGAAMGYDGEAVVMRPEPGEAGYVSMVGEEPRRGPKGYRRSNERIREDVCQAMTDHPRLDCSDVEVTVEDGQVILEGTVRDRWLKRLAEDVAYEVRGVDEVLNRIRIRREPSTTEPAAQRTEGQEKRS